ncbi:MAG: DUF3488 and transglutaminase-like domain-containing protein [Pseudomonadales bacterium]|nr:DUF3488 and transglutaminase-like domain-containing protein [Pseudomonadales bacterium]
MSHAIYPIPRNSLVWLLVTVFVALLPHFTRLPIWMWVVVLVSLVWRVQVFRQRWNYPNKWLRVAFVLGGALAIFYSYGTLLGPEAGVALLSLAYSFKLLEMYRERDAYIIVILSYFVIATIYLFEKTLFTTLYSLLVTVVITAALIGLNQTRFNNDFKRTFKLAGRMMMHSVPLMIVLFVLVPRIGPLWSMTLDNNKAKTGISDRMTPGDISELSKSSELAFRAEVLGGRLPDKKDLYWRGAVFSHFDGRTWTVNKKNFKKRLNNWDGIYVDQGSRSPYRLEYRIFMEPTNQEWVFALPFAEVHEESLFLTQNLTWAKNDVITSSISYRVTSFPGYQNSKGVLSWQERQESLQLPPSGDLRARGWAMKQYQRLGSDPQRFIRFIFDYFNQEPFSYTLRPTPLANNTIDQFIFSTRNGFCTHYAGAFVFLLRSVGIPARMVGGYQGGKLHETGRYITVRQYAAHAWAEAWVENQGWVRFDPTMAVAPERILDGAEGLVNDENFLTDSPLSPYKMRNWPVLAQLRSQLAHIDYLWTKWVVGYDSDTQYAFLSRFLGDVTAEKIGYALAVVGGGCVLVFAVLLLWDRPRHKLDPIDRAYLRFCRKLQKIGVSRSPHEGPLDFANRVSSAHPTFKEAVEEITQMYVLLKYAKPSEDTEINGNPHSNHARLANQYRELKQQIKSLRV